MPRLRDVTQLPRIEHGIAWDDTVHVFRSTDDDGPVPALCGAEVSESGHAASTMVYVLASHDRCGHCEAIVRSWWNTAP